MRNGLRDDVSHAERATYPIMTRVANYALYIMHYEFIHKSLIFL